ncbi:hypothetical protein KBTX_04100 [wastewater metagenome]|uniref:Uncharacterized protein n=2 Tax=unclassified sequences TaxID=12908 RepID=A0A5B8RFB4_9ZZZZ|nr:MULTISPECIES: hypothetical protein [Arhodomonas]MCS4503414.1 hypothetical protein [Arhodomonas aquaeolei]QEA07739.1 hypothetical protein KBTEX_04100 [uncultured organism]
MTKTTITALAAAITLGLGSATAGAASVGNNGTLGGRVSPQDLTPAGVQADAGLSAHFAGPADADIDPRLLGGELMEQDINPVRSGPTTEPVRAVKTDGRVYYGKVSPVSDSVSG